MHSRGNDFGDDFLAYFKRHVTKVENSMYYVLYLLYVLLKYF